MASFAQQEAQINPRLEAIKIQEEQSLQKREKLKQKSDKLREKEKEVDKQVEEKWEALQVFDRALQEREKRIEEEKSKLEGTWKEKEVSEVENLGTSGDRRRQAESDIEKKWAALRILNEQTRQKQEKLKRKREKLDNAQKLKEVEWEEKEKELNKLRQDIAEAETAMEVWKIFEDCGIKTRS